ncbi:histone H2A deubiquitinase MYSM1 isoform X5 [Sus scrofa]|uniref:Deubiquitinase MYSM1 n=2 Tax=Sus scrofa TaxID=9823 RepID=A0A4X1WB25_PIG|nr:histone H2A deubiquitinase MYSM1 isoform X5 [Sus scrofa]XP_020952232.1 histone H2A deubiquitinase MYSM1 isoform X5 [Sus scrofa]
MAAEEADVDVEGDVMPAAAQSGSDENTASVLQDHYLDSSWRTENGLIPWTLDSTISEENRAVIEKMLLEEEYYLSKKSLPGKFWLDQKEDDKKYTKSLQKTAKIMVHSPTKPASYSVKWTIEEKELFEQGLAKFGRRWTKIAKLIGSRTVLQVKSYARQYFKNKVKLDGPEKETLNQKNSSDFQMKNDVEGTEVWTPSGLRGRADPNLNAVKIEKLSDDEEEEVDITDEADELTSQAPPKSLSRDLLLDIPNNKRHAASQGEFIASGSQEDPISKSSKECLENIKQGAMDTRTSAGITFWTENQNTSDQKSVELNVQKCHKLMKNCDKHDGNGIIDDTKQLPSPEPCEVQKDLSDNELLFHSSCQMEAESHEEEELKPPEQEVEIDRNIIQEEEKQAIPEFFEGRQAKTPERYLKIRNYILDQWEICKPKYLNKTSVRPGLKNCGDVNCIGRIHTYLELIGAINFGCEQAVYNRPQPVDKVRIRDRRDTVEAYQLAQRLQSMRTRRRRVRDPWGNWCDAKDLEGQTFEHLSAEELARRREEEKCRPGKSSKVPRPTKSSFDPFQLIPCNFFNEEKQEPFQVKVASEALLIMDLHAHVSMAEVIGLLGGRYSEVDRIVESYFSRGGAKFIGMIVSPYNRNNPLPYSQITCLVISDEVSADGSYRLPYKFEVQQMLEEPRWGLVFEKTRWIIEKYRLSRSSVPMDKIFRRDSDLTCLQKLLECLRKTLSKVTNCFIAEEFLTQIENLFLSNYKSKPENGMAEENTTVGPKELLM